jgi:hypothetical protein
MLTGKHGSGRAWKIAKEPCGLKCGCTPSPFGWEIYDGDDAEEPIKCSQGTYRTEEAAEASPPDRRCYAVVIALRKKAAAV